MVLCPVAMAVGCSKCPVVKVCPLKSSLGDFQAESPASVKKAAVAKRKPAAKTGAARKTAKKR